MTLEDQAAVVKQLLDENARLRLIVRRMSAEIERLRADKETLKATLKQAHK